MLGILLTRRWLAGLVVAVAFAVVAVLLGNWQYSRHLERTEHRDRVEAHYHAEPVPVAGEIAGGVVRPEREWVHVRAQGRYDAPLLVRNRPHHGVFGYQVVVPMHLPEGVILVDRGWVPNAADAATLPEIPPAPGGQVSVTGWLRPGEVSLNRSLPAGQLASINVAEAEQQTGLDLVDGYLVLGEESGDAPTRPELTEPPRTGLGAHFAYALQWWMTAPLGFVMVAVFVRREHLEATGRLQPAKERKPRIWDEEDG